MSLKGNSASITCHFDEDLSQTNRGFSLLHYPTAEHGKPVYVVSCSWLDVMTLKCITETGYTQGKLTDSIVITIHNVTDKFYGKYACLGVQSSTLDINPCFLNATEELEPPHDVQHVNSTYESITIAWSDTTSENAGISYRVRYRPQKDDNNVPAAVEYTKETLFIITGLEPGTTYDVILAAVNSLGENSVDSPGILATTKGLPATDLCSKGWNIIDAVTIVVMIFIGACLLSALLYARSKMRQQRGPPDSLQAETNPSDRSHAERVVLLPSSATNLSSSRPSLEATRQSGSSENRNSAGYNSGPSTPFLPGSNDEAETVH